jgi:hypothetical protein
VLGNEKSGKSTLLERLTMMPVFPKDEDICTRMAIQLRLRRGTPTLSSLSLLERGPCMVGWEVGVGGRLERQRYSIYTQRHTVYDRAPRSMLITIESLRLENLSPVASTGYLA